MPITLTSKRQATFPKEVCEELGLRPGDRILLQKRLVDGEMMWVLRRKGIDWSFLGSARPRKKVVSHDMDAIRESIARGWGGRRRR
jgi:bifunctional DNA-binding transcriptional regulator/antitoxin component of YhaV-PrlF toxin-antitoxin module